MLRASLYSTLIAAAVLLLAGIGRGAEFVDFQVETQLYLVGEEKPINEITTIFRSGFVYDFISDPNKQRDPEPTIFDSLKGRFVVIDPQRRLWTQVSTEAVGTFSAKLKVDAAGAKEPLLNFMAAPVFTKKSTVTRSFSKARRALGWNIACARSRQNCLEWSSNTTIPRSGTPSSM